MATFAQLMEDNTLGIISCKRGEFKAVETILDKALTIMNERNDGKPLDMCLPNDCEEYTWNDWKFGIYDNELFVFYRKPFEVKEGV